MLQIALAFRTHAKHAKPAKLGVFTAVDRPADPSAGPALQIAIK